MNIFNSTFTGEQPWLYYANRRDIRRLRVDSRYMEIIVEKTDNCIALDIDFNSSTIFWTDGALEKIHRLESWLFYKTRIVQFVIA